MSLSADGPANGLAIAVVIMKSAKVRVERHRN